MSALSRHFGLFTMKAKWACWYEDLDSRVTHRYGRTQQVVKSTAD